MPEGSAAGAGTEVQIDLNAEPVKKAIEAARLEERRLASERESGLVKNRDDILNEKRDLLKKLGGTPEEVLAKLQRAEQLEHDLAASKAGVNSDVFKAEVEKQAQVKYDSRKQELQAAMDQRDGTIKDLETKLEQANREMHRLFVAKEFVLAAMPEDVRLVQEGAWDYVIDQLVPLVVAKEGEGGYPTARFKVSGALVPSLDGKKTADGLMDMREFITAARQGKGPLPKLGFCFVSAGRGSGTQEPTRTGNGHKGNWHQMTAEEQTAYVNENGAAAARELIDRSPRPKAAVTTAAG